MDSTHLHLILTHFPIIGTLIGTIMLFFSIWKKNYIVQEIALGIILIMALISIPVFLTGEPAEESIENLPGVVESIIEEHEESAEIAFWVMIATGVVALAGIALRVIQNSAANSIVMISLALGIITSGLMARTGYLGGQIRHTEIRGDAIAGQTPDQVGAEQQQEEDD